MIQASPSALHEMIFRPYILNLMRRHFHSIRLLGEPPNADKGAILLLPNHSTWWDGFFVYLLKVKLFHRPIFLMMLEEQLRRNRFFSRVGAYSIEPRSVKKSLESLSYTQRLLAQKAVVCIFPQGELLPWGVRPLVYKRGVELLIRQAPEPVRVIQAAFRAEYLSDQRADVFIRLSEVTDLWPSSEDLTERLQSRHEALLDELQEQIIRREEGKVLLQGKASINESFAMWRHRLSRKRDRR